MFSAMKLYGKSLLDYYNGDESAVQAYRRDDGKTVQVPVSAYFRSYHNLFPLESEAIELCRGKVLNVGAGTGVHALILQEKGFEVFALDISEEACEVMRDRGVKDVKCIDFFELDTDRFDTVLMLGRNIGMAGILSNLESLLTHLKKFTKDDGQILLNSFGMAHSEEEDDIRYMSANREADRYYGEVRYQILYKDMVGEMFNWLYRDFITLKDYAKKAGLEAELIAQQDDGNYLARLITCKI